MIMMKRINSPLHSLGGEKSLVWNIQRSYPASHRAQKQAQLQTICGAGMLNRTTALMVIPLGLSPVPSSAVLKRTIFYQDMAQLRIASVLTSYWERSAAPTMDWAVMSILQNCTAWGSH